MCGIIFQHVNQRLQIQMRKTNPMIFVADNQSLEGIIVSTRQNLGPLLQAQLLVSYIVLHAVATAGSCPHEI